MTQPTHPHTHTAERASSPHPPSLWPQSRCSATCCGCWLTTQSPRGWLMRWARMLTCSLVARSRCRRESGILEAVQ